MGLEEIRAHIDEIDQRIIKLLAERYACVKQAARYKKSDAEVAAPSRVEQVVEKVRTHAQAHDLPPELAEAVYRTMIRELIAREHQERRKGHDPA